MRVLLGLAALAGVVTGQQTVTLSSQGSPVAPQSVATVGTCGAYVFTYVSTTFTVPNSFIAPGTNANLVNSASTCVQGAAYTYTMPAKSTAMLFKVTTGPSVSQLQFKYFGYTGAGGFSTYFCDPCTTSTYTATTFSPTGTTGSCVQQPLAAPNYTCAQFTRLYLYSGLTVAGPNAFGIQVYDNNLENVATSFSMTVPAGAVTGDPQIVGMQGQDFQVHGMPDEIFNIVSYPTIQVNARFTYLESADCHDNFTACFAHPGTYISEEGFRLGKDKIRVTAGTFKSGLTVHVNGKKTKQNTDLKSGAVELVNHRRVVIHTDIMKFTVSNSDKFLNQEIELKDDKLVALGAERRQLKDNQRFHPEVPLHGLQGQTWRNVEYASGLEYEGSIMDYHVVDGNLYGTDFVFNQFQA